MRSPARACFSRPRRCSARARSSSAAPTTSSPPSRRRNARAAWWRSPRAITRRGLRRRRASSACRQSSSCRRMRHAPLVPPYDDALIIAGQSTTGREIVEDLAGQGLVPDVIAVTASGGGLTAGIALAVKARRPQARLYTAEPEGFDDHARSFKSGRREKNATLTGTICDALMAQTPGEMTFAINRELVGAGVAVSDEEVAAAVAFAFRELKLVVEPGGAAALAALISGKIDVKGKIAVAVLSGGNVDPDLFYRLVA